MSEEQPSRSPIPTLIVVALLVGGGWYFFQHYQISGLDKVSVREKPAEESQLEYVSFRDDGTDFNDATETESVENPFTRARNNSTATSRTDQTRLANRRLRIASWSLDGFSTEKLANEAIRETIIRVVRQFDLIALQQVTATQRDLLPRMLQAINVTDPRYDYVIGKPTGASDRSTQLAFIFDRTRLHVDRSQTYSVADPQNQMTFDPLVAWLAVGPDVGSAWTFSLVNVQIDLARAAQEVKLLSGIMASVRFDGRGEDDVILAGLFQADDAYLLPTMGGSELKAAVRSTSTDIVGQHQVSNLLVSGEATSEFVGRGGVLDFLRVFNLSIDEAQAVSPHLPVYAEFSVIEGESF